MFVPALANVLLLLLLHTIFSIYNSAVIVVAGENSFLLSGGEIRYTSVPFENKRQNVISLYQLGDESAKMAANGIRLVLVWKSN